MGGFISFIITVFLIYSVLIYICWNSIIEVINYIKKKVFLSSYYDVYLMISSGLVMIGYLVIFYTYSEIGREAIRNLVPILVFILAVLSGLAIRKKAGFICVLAVFLLVVIVTEDSAIFHGRKHGTEEYMVRISQIENFWEENITISNENNRWENTIAGKLGVSWEYVFTAPTGSGWNFYYNPYNDVSVNDVPIYEKYLIIPISMDEYSMYEDIKIYTSSGFRIISENDEVILLVNTIYD